MIEQIEARIAKYTAVPKENGEGLQVLNYKVVKDVRLSCSSHPVCHNSAEHSMQSANPSYQ